MEIDPPDPGSGSTGETKPRETLQAQAVQRLKENVRLLAELLSRWAGSSDKKQLYRDQAARYVQNINELVPVLQRAHRLQGADITLWTDFLDAWDEGTNWSKAKPYIVELNDRLKDLEP